MDHFNLINTFTIPFYLLYMRRSLLGKGWKNPLLWGLWLFFTANASWYYLLFLLVLSPWWLIAVLAEKDLKSNLRWGAIQTLRAAGVFLLLFLPQMAVILRGYEPGAHNREIGALFFWSADLLNFILPPWLGKSLSPPPHPATTALSGEGEFAVFPGILVYFLVLLSLFPYRRSRGKFWLGMAFLGALLALGPMLKISGNPANFWLPAYWFMKLPLLGALRTLVRWSLIFQLGLILFIAFNLKRLEDRISFRWKLPSWAFSAILTLLIFAENWPGPFPHSPARPPEALRRMAEIVPCGAVLHLPFGGPREEGFYMFLQTLHEIPICNGYTAFRTGPNQLSSYPALSALGRGLPIPGSADALGKESARLDLKWIVIHPDFYRETSQARWVETVVSERMNGRLFAREDGLWVYQLLRDYDKVPPLSPLGEQLGEPGISGRVD
jgi:hypothetical protein